MLEGEESSLTQNPETGGSDDVEKVWGGAREGFENLGLALLKFPSSEEREARFRKKEGKRVRMWPGT